MSIRKNIKVVWIIVNVSKSFKRSTSSISQFVIIQLFICISCISYSCKFGVHFHPFWMSNTLGRIIFVHLLRSTVFLNLSQFQKLPRYQHYSLHRFCSIIFQKIPPLDGRILSIYYIFCLNKLQLLNIVIQQQTQIFYH